MISRRAILKFLLTLPVGVTLKADGVPKVVIAGAGLAGLCAGYELIQNGCNVLILEADERAGGRVLTLRKPFSDGLYAEAGGMFITNAQENILRYAREFSIPLLQYDISRTKGYVLVNKGIRTIATLNSQLEAFDLRKEERMLGLTGLWDRYVTPTINEALQDSQPLDSLKRSCDSISMAEFLKMKGASDAAISVLRLGFLDSFGNGIDEASALQYLRMEYLNSNSTQTYVIDGGSETLTSAFTASLSESIQLNSRVVRVEQSKSGVTITMQRKEDMTQQVHADFFISTLPLPALRKVKFQPQLSREKRKAMESIPYADINRIYLQCSERFWQQDGVVGEADTDLSVMRILEQPLARRQKKGILEAFVSGENARRMMGQNQDAQIKEALAGMEIVHPGARKHFERGTTWCWNSQHYIGGAFAWFRPGQISSFGEALPSPEGNVHFAGEHTSPWMATMEGALESGKRAANEILSTIRMRGSQRVKDPSLEVTGPHTLW